MKRIFLLIATNLAILLVASIVMSILGVNTQTMGGLLVFAAIFWFWWLIYQFSHFKMDGEENHGL